MEPDEVMMEEPETAGKNLARKIPKEELLSFKPTGRVVPVDNLAKEFGLMRDACGRKVTPEILGRICRKSGTHLVKLVSPRVDGDHAVLRFGPAGESKRFALLPSVNAADIPFAKIIFRPLEIMGHSPRSLVEHVMNPDDISERVCSAFEAAFGAEGLDAIRSALLGSAPVVTKLSAGEFPIVFIPSPKGGDLQVTPVSPAASYMGMKDVTDPYFKKQERDAPRVPRGRWHWQSVSGKPQNISGAIGGPRRRFLAEMPRSMDQSEAELYRFVLGGEFPRWRERDVDIWVLRYADRLDEGREFNNADTRAGLDRLADILIRDANEFAAETMEYAERFADAEHIPREKLKAPPRTAQILLRRPWFRGGFHRARRALNSAHFDYREKLYRKPGGD